MVLRCLCLLLHFLHAFSAVVIVGKRDLGMVANSSVSLSLDLLPPSLYPVELTASATAGFSVGVSASSVSQSSVVVRWERGQSKQLVYVRSTQCTLTGTLTLSPTTSSNSTYTGILPAPSSVNLFCAYPGRVEVSLADGSSLSDLTLRDGQSVDVVLKAIRQRASASSEGGVIPLNLPPGIRSNQNGSVLFPRFRSDQLSTEIQVTLFPDASAPRSSQIAFGPVLSDDPEWKGVVPLPVFVLRTVHPGAITANPTSLGCLVGSKATFSITLSAPSESGLTIGVSGPVGIALSTGLSSLVVPPGSTGPFFFDVTCAVATAGNLAFSPVDSLDPAFDEVQVQPRQLSIYATTPARIELKDSTGSALASPEMRLLVQGSMTFRVLLLPASSRSIGTGGGQIRWVISSGFTVTPSPLSFGALVGPLEIIVKVTSTSTSTTPGNLTFTPSISADPQWHFILPTPFTSLLLIPVRPANFLLSGPSQVLMGQVSQLSLTPSAPPNTLTRVTLTASSGYKLGSPALQDSLTVDFPAGLTSPVNISITALSQTSGTIAVTLVETDDVQFKNSSLPKLNVTSFAPGSVYVRFGDGTELPPVVTILIGQSYLFALVVDRGNGLINATLPGGEIPFSAPSALSLTKDGQPLSSPFSFAPLVGGTPSRLSTFTVTADEVLRGNISFESVNSASNSIVWANVLPQPSRIVFNAVRPAIISVSVSTLSLLTSSFAPIILRASSPPTANVSLTLSVPAGFRVRLDPLGPSSASTTPSTTSLFDPSQVLVVFAPGVTSQTLIVQADSTVHSYSLLSLSRVSSADVRYNGILPSVNSISLSSTERGRLTVTLPPWDNRPPISVVAGSLLNITLAFSGSEDTGGTLIALCPGFTFLGGGSSSFVLTFNGNSSVALSLQAPNVPDLEIALTFLNISSQDAEWNGVQADIPRIPLKVVDIPALSLLSPSILTLQTNQESSIVLRIRPSPSSSVSIPVSVPSQCTIRGQDEGSIVIPALQKESFLVNFTCTQPSSSSSPSLILFGSTQSTDRLLNGLTVQPTNISLVIYSPGRILATYSNGTQLLSTNNENGSGAVGDLRFPIGVVTFGLATVSNNNNNSNGSSARPRATLIAIAPPGCPLMSGPGIETRSDSAALFSLDTSSQAPLFLFSLNCSSEQGAKAGSGLSVNFGDVSSANLEWNKVSVEPSVVKFSLFALSTITTSTDTLLLRYPDVSTITLNVVDAPLYDIFIPYSISGAFALATNNNTNSNTNTSVILFPRSRLRVNISIIALKPGSAEGILLLDRPESQDVHYAGTRIRPDSVFLQAIEDAKIKILDINNNTNELQQIVMQQTRNITVNFTWEHITNFTTTMIFYTPDSRNFAIIPSSFSFQSGPQKWISVPVSITSASSTSTPNASLVVGVDTSRDPQWTRVSLQIPLVVVNPAVCNATPSSLQILVDTTISVRLQCSLAPSQDVWIRVNLPPTLRMVTSESNNNNNNNDNDTYLVRLSSGATSVTITVASTTASPCSTDLTSPITFEVSSSGDPSFSVGVPLASPVPILVYQYGSARVVFASTPNRFVNAIIWRRDQNESSKYLLNFFDTCNRSLVLPPSLPSLILRPSSPELQADFTTECENSTRCRLGFSVISSVTWWNESRSLALALEGRDPLWNEVAVVPNVLPVVSDFQGNGALAIKWETFPPFFINDTIVARFILSPAPVRPLSIQFARLPDVQIISSTTMNISAGQSEASLTFRPVAEGNFSWPFSVVSRDTIYTSLPVFSFDVLTPPVLETLSPTSAPTPRIITRRPSRQPTFFPTLSPTTLFPTFAPTQLPTSLPTNNPTLVPTTHFPTFLPTIPPTTFAPSNRPPTPVPPSQTPPPTNTPFFPTTSPIIASTRAPTSRPTLPPFTFRPTPFRRLPSRAPTASPSFEATPSPSPAPAAPAPTNGRAIETVAPTPRSDVPLRAQLLLNVTTDERGNVNGMTPTEFLTALSMDLMGGLSTTGIALAPGQLTAVSLQNNTGRRRLLASESLLVDLNLLPVENAEHSSQEVYSALGTALRTRDERVLGYSPLTRAIDPDYYPDPITLQNCSDGRFAVTCAPNNPRGIAVPAPTAFDPYGVSFLPRLLWWHVILIGAIIVCCLCILLFFLCRCCCKRDEPAHKAAPPEPNIRSSNAPVTAAGGMPDGSHGIPMAVLAPVKNTPSTRLVAVPEEKKGDTLKPPRPPIAVVIRDSPEGDKWRCPQCTYDNDSGTACNICGAPRTSRVPVLSPHAPVFGVIEPKKKMPKKKMKPEASSPPQNVPQTASLTPPVPDNVFGAVDQVEWAAKPEPGMVAWEGTEQKQPPDEDGFEEVQEDAELVVDRPAPELPSWERVTTYASRQPEITEDMGLMSRGGNDAVNSSHAMDREAVDRIAAALGGEEDGAEEGDDEEEDEAEDPEARAARKQARKERRLERRAKKAIKREERRKRRGERTPTGESVEGEEVATPGSLERPSSEAVSEEKSLNDDDRASMTNDDEARLARKAERKEKKRLKKEVRREKRAQRSGGAADEGEEDRLAEPGALGNNSIAPIPEEGEPEEHPEG